MSYIRTKYGVYRLVDTYYMCVDGVKTYMYDNNGRGVEIRSSQILKQSENLEELCDMFVYCKRGFYEIYRQLDFAHYDKEYIKNGGTIKGAIWTSKGLIYVAKMNENGELELI